MRRSAFALLLVTLVLVTFVASAVSRRGTAQRPEERRGAAFAFRASRTLEDPLPAPDAALRQMRRIAPAQYDSAQVARLIAEDRDSYMHEMIVRSLARWPVHRRSLLHVWIDRDPRLHNWNPNFPDIAASVFPEWIAAGVPLDFDFVGDSSRADIRITWVDSFPEPDVLGVTRPVMGTNGWIVGADIQMTTADYQRLAMTAEDIRATARHEVGHALGLPHLIEEESVMYPTSKALFISPRDAATLRLLYILPPGRIR